MVLHLPKEYVQLALSILLHLIGHFWMILCYFHLFLKAKLSYNIVLPFCKRLCAQEFKEQHSLSLSSLPPFIKTH